LFGLAFKSRILHSQFICGVIYHISIVVVIVFNIFKKLSIVSFSVFQITFFEAHREKMVF